MPKIIFTATPELPRDIAYLAYKKGDVVMLGLDSCRRWIQRGVAKFYDEPVPEAAPVADEPVIEAAEVETEVAEPAEAPKPEKRWRGRSGR